MSKTFEELKRRNVFRVAAAYIVGGWILIQVSDALFPALNLPDWTMRFVAGLIVLGFPVALIIAWAFEITPDGVKRDTGQADLSHSGGKRLDIATLIGVAVVIGLIAWQRLDVPNRAVPASTQEITMTAAAPSVAVLAFENMSPDPANEFFAEGISEEILNVLAGIDGLAVASRTSAFSFADSEVPIPEIARQLSVNHVLEGSVRKQGMRVRITAQLIDASNDTHLWSNTYDRDLDDIFVVQEEIALAISEALLGALGMQQVSVAALTEDYVAYELFLSGRQRFYQRGIANLDQAIADLQAAVARDPDFAEAWAFLAAAQNVSLGYFVHDDAEALRRNTLADAAARRSLELDPDQALAVAAQGQIMTYTDMSAVFPLLRRSVELAPDDAGLHMWLADKLFRVAGRMTEALKHYERAIELDPLSGINQGTIGVAYLMAGRREEGRAFIRGASEAGWNAAEIMLLVDLVHTGETQEATDLLASVFNADTRPAGDAEIFIELWRRILASDVSSDEAEQVERELLAIDPGNYLLAEFLALGDPERFLDRWFQYTVIGEDYHFHRLAFSPAGHGVVEHPRFLELARQNGTMNLWEELGFPFECQVTNNGQSDHLSCPNWPD